MISILNPGVLLAFILSVGIMSGLGYYRGGKDARKEVAAEQAKAAAEARDAEIELQRLNNRWTNEYIARVAKQQEKARALPKITIATDCTVPANVSRVLNDAQSLPNNAGTRSAAGAAGETVDSTCAAELEIAKRNYAEVCVPNTEQLTELQKRWEAVRSKINK